MNKIYKTIIGNDCRHTIDVQDIAYIKTAHEAYKGLYTTDIFLKNGNIISVTGKMVSGDEVREFLSNDDKNELNIKDEDVDMNATDEMESRRNSNFSGL